MKQIIVHVGDLTNDEKQRVNEALAKLVNVSKIEGVTTDMAWFYAPSSLGIQVGWNSIYKSESPTHTPQQVLEMASSVDQDVILADTLVIPDSSGDIIYDSTLDALNQLIKQRAKAGKGVSVKLDKNGMAVMVEKRKVRKDFDPGKEYSVNISGCTDEEKKEVQQAFFDAGFTWDSGGTVYRYLDAVKYTNTSNDRYVTAQLMYASTTWGCNMTAKEFLELVYEPEKVGHVHAELMMQLAEDAKTHAEPWKLWQSKSEAFDWADCQFSPMWDPSLEYRRKPKTHFVHGVEIPDLRVKGFDSGNVLVGYCPDPLDAKLHAEYYSRGPETTNKFLELGILYEYTEEGKQAAILHSKAMLNIK